MSYLSKLRALETKYDGPIPQRALNMARHGDARKVAWFKARANYHFYARMQANAMRAFRATDDMDRRLVLLGDALQCRREKLAWQKRAADLDWQKPYSEAAE